MKNKRVSGLVLSAFLGLALGALTAQAQTNFSWTNAAGGNWSSGASWVNELSGTQPGPGGSSNYIINFAIPSGIFGANNDLGTTAANGFQLNQLNFNNAPVTLSGSNLVFMTGQNLALPSLIQSGASNVTLNLGVTLANNTFFGGTGTGAVTVNGNVTGAGSLLMGGNYAVTLNASNSYYGGTIITNGTLRVGSSWALGTNRAVTVSGAGTLDLNSVDLRTNYVYNVTISGGGVSNLGAVVNNGAVDLTNLGLDNLTLAGDATIGGTKRWGVQNSANLAGFRLTKVGVNQVSFNGGTMTAGNLDINGGIVSFESGIIVGIGGAVTLNTGGTLMLYGTTAGNITRTIVANGGILQLGSGGSGAGAANSPITLQSNLVINAGGNYVLNGVISETGGSYVVTKTGTANLTLTAANTYSGGTTNLQGFLILSNNNAMGTGLLVMNGGALSNNLSGAVYTNTISLQAAAQIYSPANMTTTFSGPITNTGALTIAAGPNAAGGRGVVMLLGTNTFTGNFTISNGVVVINNSQGLGLGNKTVTINRQSASDPTLALDGSAGPIVLGTNLSFTISQSTMSAISNAAGNNIINGNVSMQGGGGGTWLTAGAGTLTLNGTFTPNTVSRSIIMDGAGTGIINGVISDGGFAATNFFTKQGPGLWILAGNNFLTNTIGTDVVAGGTLQIGNGGTTGSLGNQTNAVNITTNGILAFNRSDSISISNQLIGGTGRVAQYGSGVLLLAGSNTYGGGTIINNGVLGFAFQGAMGGTGPNVSNNVGGALMVAGAYTNIAGWISSGRLAINSGGSMALVSNSTETINFGIYGNLYLGAMVGNSVNYGGSFTPIGGLYRLGGGGGTLNYASALTGATSLVVGGGLGTVVLMASNTFTGGTVVSNGAIAALANNNALGIGGATVYGANGTNGSGVALLNNVTITNALALVSTASGDVRVGNTSGLNTLSGPVTINSATGLVSFDANGGLFNINGSLSGGDFTVRGSATGSITGSIAVPGTLTKTEAGLWTIGAVGPAYSWSNLAVQAGTLRLGAASVLPTSSLVTMGLAADGNAATLDLNGFGQTVAGVTQGAGTSGAKLIGNSAAALATFTISNANNYIYTGGIGGNLNLVKDGAGTQAIGNSSYAGSTLISNGTLQLGTNGLFGTLGLGPVTNNGVLAFDRADTYIVANAITGPGPLVQMGSGTTLLMGPNTFTGGLLITNGEAGALVDSGWGAVGNLITVSGGALAVNGTTIQTMGLHPLNAGSFTGAVDVFSPYGAFVIATNITGGGSLTKLGKGYLILTGTNVYTGGTTVSNGTLRLLAGGGNNLLAANGTITLAGGTLDLAGSSQTTATLAFQGGLVQNGSITVATSNLITAAGVAGVDLNLQGSAPLVKTGSGYLALLGHNTLNGPLVLSNGTLAIVSDANIGGSGSSAITFAGGLLGIIGNAETDLGNHVVNYSTFNGGFDIATPGAVFNLTNVLGGSSGLIKAGAGILALSAANTYSGPTLVTAGTLQVDNGGTTGTLGTGNVSNNGNLVFFRSDSYGVTNGVTGTGATTVRSGVMTYGGGLTNNQLFVADTTGLSATLNLTGGVVRLTQTANNQFIVGDAINASGTVNMSGGLLVASNELWIGGAVSNSRGYFNLSGGTVVVTNYTAVGGRGAGTVGNYGELNISGGAWSNQVNNGITVGNLVGNTGRVSVTGGNLYVQNALNVGESGVGFMTVGSTGTVTVGGSIGVGLNAGSRGSLVQTGGSMNVLTELDVGVNAAGSYGFYQLASGNFTNNSWIQIGKTGIGVMYQTGGTNTELNTGNGLVLANSSSSTGVVYMANTLYRDAGQIGLNWSGNGRSEMTIDTGAVVTVGTTGVRFNVGSGNGTDILNLNGGLLQVGNIFKVGGTGANILNINGGTIRGTSSTNLIGAIPGAFGLEAAYIYGNGATIDASNFNLTISQNLLAPTGNGVTSIPWSGIVTGYVGAPYVAISGGGGTGATAIALFDYTSGSVTGIVVTSAGVGYTNTPIVSLLSGGFASNYVGVALIGTNTSGALIKQGVGTLQLTGTNTYAGGSVINNGLLGFASTNALGTGLITINGGGALATTGAYSSVAAWLNSSRISTNSSGVLALGLGNAAETIDFTSMGSGVYNNLFVGAVAGTPVLFTGSLGFINGDFRLGGGGGTLAITSDLGGNTLTIGAPGTSTTNTVAFNGTLNFGNGITVNSNVALSVAGQVLGGPITLNNATLQVRGTAVNSLTLNPAITGNVTLDINTAGNLLTVNNNLSVGGALTKLGAGTLALGGSNNIAGNVTIAAGALRVANSDALDGLGSNVTVASGAALQLQVGITTEVGDLLTLNGTGVNNDGALRNISGSNTWAGLVTLGSATRINSDADLLTLTGPVTNGANLLTFGGMGNTLLSGAILGGSGALTKDGAGTLTLSGSNLYTGVTTISAGGLVLDFSRPGAPTNNIINNTALSMGYNVLGTNASLLVIGQGSGVTTQSFNGVTVNPGNNSIMASNYNGGGAMVLNLGAINRATGGGILDVSLPGGAGKITTTTATNTVGTFDALVTVNQQDWAALNGTSLTAFTNYTLVASVLSNLNTLVVKIDSTASVTNTLGADPTNIKTLLVNDPTTNHVIYMGGSQTLHMGTPGAIMVASGSGGLTIGAGMNDGILTAGSDLTLINYSASNLVINSAYNNSAGTLTVNGGGPVIFNGVINSTAAAYFNNGTVTFNNQNTMTGAFNVRGGTVTLSDTSFSTLGAVTLQGSSVLNLNGTGITTLGANMTVGSLAGDRATVVINASASMAKLLIGTVNGAAGAVVQNSGDVSVGPGVGGTDVLSIGNSGYGYYQMNGGTLTSGQFAPGGSGANGTGVFEQNSGTTAVNGQWFIFGWGGTSRGVLNLFGGTMAQTYIASAQSLTMGYAGNTNFAAINLLGSSVSLDATAGGPSNYVEMMKTAGGSTSVINLNAGTMVANQIKASTAGLTLLNFNGGTLQANPNTAFSNSFINSLTAATIYSGGATFDTANNANPIIVPQNLVGPIGYGVTGIALTTNGAGYIGAPVVLLTGGNGTGATAIAQVDLSVGQVTNILITSAGSGYLPTDALTVQLVGGGFTSAALPGTINWAANANTGALTKINGGTLMLTGTNNYGGTSVINGGTLVFLPAATTTNFIGGLGGPGTMLHNGLGVTILGGDSSTFTGSATINTGTVQFATQNSLPTLALGGVLVNNPGVVALGFTGVDGIQALTNFNTTSPGIIAFTPASITDKFNFAGANLSNAFFGGMSSATFGGTYTPYNGVYQLTGVRGDTLTYTNAIGGGSSVIIGSGTGSSSGTVVFTTANNVYTGATIINSNSTLQAGAANVIGSQSAVTINNGATFNVAGNSQSIGSLAGLGSIINTNAKMTLTVGNNGTSTLFGGTISGTQSLVKTGSGTLTLTNSNFYTGSTIVSGGTLQLGPTGTNYAGLWETTTNAQSIWAPATILNKIAVASYPRFAETNFGTSSGYPASWPSNFPATVTIGYSGYVYNNSGSNVTWTFAANIDDGSQLLIDGNLLLNSAGNATVMTNVTLTPGAHLIDYRVQNGTGGAGSYGIFGMGTGAGSMGFAYDPLGRGQAILANYIIPIDPGNGTLFTTRGDILPAATPLYIASGATVDLNSAVQNVSLLSDYAGAGGIITNTGATNAILQIATLAGSNATFSGNITDGDVSNNIALWIGGSGTQVLSGTNSYRGGTVIAGGVLQFGRISAISPYSNILINVNGTLANAGAYTNVTDWLNTGRIDSNSAGSLAFTTTANLNETINMATAGGGFYSNLYLGAIGNIAFSGNVLPVAGVTRLGGGGGQLTYVNPITTGTVAIGGGLGTVVLTNVLNTYTGTVLNAGTLQITSDAALGIVNPSQTNITFALGGTLQAGAPNLTLAAARNMAVASNAFGTLDNNGFNFTVNGNIGGTGTLVTVGSGTTTLGGLTNTVMGIMARSGTLAFAPGSSNNIAGGSSSNNYGLQVAPATGDRAIVTFNPTAGLTNIILGTLRVGNATNSAGAVYQSGGLVLENGPQANPDFAIGSGGGYGYYKITGGTLVGQQMEISGINTGAGGVGVMDILGGTVSPQLYFMIGRSANGIGVVTVANGGVLNGSQNNIGIAFGWDANANGYGVLNILNGGYVNAGISGKTLDLGAQSAGNTGILNLNSGGTASVYQITRSQTGTGIANFNGGLLIASSTANSTLINNNLTAAYVYPGGLNISNNVNSAILQPLWAPTGYGVTGIGLADGGTNYIGAPAIMITGGNGTGATAIAQISAAGVITNILVTGNGSGYLPGDVLTVQLLGGGATVNGTVGVVTLSANGSGSLVKTGLGTLTLGANNTYTGLTTIAAGNLQIGNNGNIGALANPNVIFQNTNSWLGFSRSDMITNSLNVLTPNGNITQLVQNGSGILVLTNTVLNFNQVAVSNGLMLFASAAAMPTNTTGRNSIILATGGGVLVSNLYGSINGWLNSGMLATNGGGGLLALTTGVNTENVNWVGTAGTYSNTYLGVAPGSLATYLGTLTPVGTNYLVGGGGGTLVIGNNNAFTDLNMLTNRSVSFGAGSVSSAVYVVGPQIYTGGTTITNTLVSITADNNLGYGGVTINSGGVLQITNAPNFSTIKTITLNTLGALNSGIDVGTGSTATLFGAVSAAGTGAETLTKWGGGTLIFSGNNVTVGATGQRWAFSGGTTIVDTNAIVTSASTYQIIGYNSTDIASLLLRNNGQFYTTGNGGNNLILADQGGAIGVMTVQDNALFMQGGGGGAYIGNGGFGTLNVNGGTVFLGNTIIGASGGVGNLNINGGTLSVGTLTVENSTGSATNNLNGGVELIRGAYVTKAGGTGVFNFNGGTLRAGTNFVFSNLFTTATLNGPATLDSSNYTVTLNQAFTGTGTLTKVGSGTLIVNSPSNTFASISDNAGVIQFSAVGGMTPGRTLSINAGAAAGYAAGNAGGLDQAFLLRVASNSVGTVALVNNSTNNLDFSLAGANLTNVSLGAFGATAWTNSGVFTNFGSTYRLGGGGGTLVLTNSMLVGTGTNLVAFGNGGFGTLILTGSNTWSGTTVNGGVVQYGSTNAMGALVTVNTGGAVANNGALDTNLLARITAASAGAFALVANNAAGGINLGAYPNLSLGAANGSWTNSGAIQPFGTTYQLGGGGGTLVITNNSLNGAGTNLVAFSGSNAGSLILTGTNTYDGGTWIGALGTATVATVSLGSGAVTNNGALIFGVLGNTGTFANAISGTGTLTKQGSNSWVVLTGSNTYTGLTVVYNDVNNGFPTQLGALVLSNTTGGVAINGNVQIGSTGPNDAYLRLGANEQIVDSAVITFGTTGFGRFEMLGKNETVAGISAPLATAVIEVNDNNNGDTNAGPSILTLNTPAFSNFVYTGYMRDNRQIGPSNRLSLVKSGLGQQMLYGSLITYTGPTTVNNGVLALSNTTVWASPVTINGGQLLLATPGNTTVMNQMVTNNANNGLGFTGGTAFSIGGLAGNGSITLWSQTGGGVTLNIGGNNSNAITYSGTLTDVGPGNFYQGNVVKSGSGIQTLTGTNTYNGYTLLNSGILQADAGAGLSPYANVTINGGSLASVSGSITNALGLGPNQFNILNGGFSAVGTPTVVSLGGAASPTTLIWGTPGFAPTTFVLNETNANNALTLVNNLDLFGLNVAVGANATNPSVMATMSGVISDSVGTGTFIKRGVGTLVLAGANTYTGATYITAGNLAMTNDLLGAIGAPLYLTNNGALEAQGSFTLNNRAVTLQTGGGKFNVDAGVTLTITNNITATGGALTKVGLGTLLLAAGPTQSQLTNGLNANAGTLLLTNDNIWLNNSAANIGQNIGDVGTVILGGNAIWATTNMPSGTGGQILAVGNAGRGTLIIQDNANITNRLYVGNAVGSAGAVYQRSGTSVWWNGTADDGRIGMTGYGYYEMAGGTLTFEGYTQIGRDYTGVGVMSQLGGSVLQTNILGGNLSISRGGVGVYNMLGGTFVNPTGIDLGNSSDNGTSNGVAIFNMMGGSALVAANISMVNRTNMLAVLNLDGGVMTVNQITRNNTTTGSLAFVNFNGGTLQARQNGALFNTGSSAPDGTYIYAGGGTLDASNFVVSLPINLLAPQGQGVTSISLGAPTLAGYIGSPYVQISGGGGTGATAFAQFDSVAGLVTGIVMTSYGYGYTGSPTVMLVGNITNTLPAPAIAANTSGSLTVVGGTNGVMILSGTNTYAGGTIVNRGNLIFSSALALPASGNVLVNFGGSMGVTNASAPFTSVSSWLTSGRLSTLSTGTLSLAYNSLSSETIDFNTTGFTSLSLGALTGLTVTNNANLVPNNLIYRLGGGWGTLVITNNLVLGNALNAFGSGSGGTLILSGNNSFPNGVTINPIGVVQANSPGALGGLTGIVVPYGATLADGLAMDNTFLGTISGISSGTLALAVNDSNPLDFNATALPTVSLGAVGMVTNSGVITPFGGLVYRLGGGGGTLVLTNNNALTGAGQSLLAFASGTGGSLVLSGTNDYAGGTWIGPLGTATVSTVSLGSGAVTNNGVLMFSQTANGTNSNLIGGTGMLLFTNNAGLITLVGNNTFSGGTVVSSNAWVQIYNANALGVGSVALTNGGLLRFSGGLTITNAVTIYGGDGRDHQSDYHGSLQSTSGTNVWAGLITMGTGGGRIDVDAGQLRISGGISGVSGAILQPQTGATLIVDTTPILLPGQTLTFTGGGTNLLSVAGNNFSTALIDYGNTPTKLGVDNAMPTNVTMQLGANNGQDVSSPQFWLNGYNQTIGSLTVASSNQSSLNVISVGTNTLTINGNMTVGSTISNSTTRLAVFGSGALIVNKIGGIIQIGNNSADNGSTIGNQGNRATNDMSALGTFIANLGSTGRFNIGDPNGQANAINDAGDRSTVLLATNSTIIAGALNIGDNNQFSTLQTLLLGAGPNIINASTVTVAAAMGGRNYGLVQFNGATGSLALSNAVGGRAELMVANSINANTAAAITGTVSLVGHQTDLYLGDLFLGNALPTGANNNTGDRLGFFSFDTGTLDVTNILMGSRAGSFITNNSSAYATLTISGGVSRIGQIAMGTNYNWSAVGANDAGKANAILNLLGGSVTVSNGINRGLGGGSNDVVQVNLAGASLDMNGSAIGGTGLFYAVTLNASNGVLMNLGQLNGGATPLVKAGPGTLQLLGNNTYSGGTLISAGLLQLGDGATRNGSVLGNITNNAQLAFANPFDQTFSGFISGPGSLTKSGSGQLTLSALNTFTGATTNNAGTLRLGDASANNGTVGGNIVNNSLLMFANPNPQSFGGTISGAGSLTKMSGGVLTLTAANSYLGNTTISNGTLQLGINNALPAATSVSAGTGGNLDLAGFNQLLSGVDAYLGVITNSGVASTLTVNMTTTQNFGGTLAGPANFTVQGGGRLYMSGATSPTFTGNVNISNATVLVQGTLTTGGLIQVFNGGTLGGTGALSSVQVNSGGTYSPGFSPGTQLVVSLTLNGGLFNETIVSSNNYSLLIAANGFTLALGSTNYLHLALNNFVLQGGATYLMVQDNSVTPWNGNQFFLSDALSPDNGATLTNGATFLAVGESSSTNMFRINYTFDSVSGTTVGGNDILLTVIPEPTTVNLLVLIGAAAGLRRLLRKRRQAR
jgi:autotransporter-associated beta strand protein